MSKRPDTGQKTSKGRPRQPYSLRSLAKEFERRAVEGEDTSPQPKIAPSSRHGYSKSNLWRMRKWGEMQERHPWMAQRQWSIYATLKVRDALRTFPFRWRKRAMRALERAAARRPDMTAAQAIEFLGDCYRRYHRAEGASG